MSLPLTEVDSTTKLVTKHVIVWSLFALLMAQGIAREVRFDYGPLGPALFGAALVPVIFVGPLAIAIYRKVRFRWAALASILGLVFCTTLIAFSGLVLNSDSPNLTHGNVVGAVLFVVSAGLQTLIACMLPRYYR